MPVNESAAQLAIKAYVEERARPSSTELGALNIALTVYAQVCELPVQLSDRIKVQPHAVFYRNKNARLTRQELAFTHLLLSKKGALVSYREILPVIYPHHVSHSVNEESRSSIRNLARRARAKFLYIDPTFDAIKSQHGLGYSWEET